MRYLGAFLLLVGLAALAIDASLSLGSDPGFALRSLGAWWAEIDRDSLLLLQPAVERHLSPALWDPGIQTLLEWPAAPQFIGLGLVLMLLFRRRKPRKATNGLTFGKR